MQGNLESKLIAQGTKPLELRGGQVGSEKHTKYKKKDLSSDVFVDLFFFFGSLIEIYFKVKMPKIINFEKTPIKWKAKS